MGRKPDNPISRLRPKEKEFLKRYMLGEAPHRIAQDIWPNINGGPVFKAAQIMNLDRFEDALAFLTDPMLSRKALAMKQLIIAEGAKEDRDKIAAIRSASQALVGGISVRSRDRRPGARIGKTQKIKVTPLPEDELKVKIEQLAEKAGDYGHQKPPS